MSSQEEYWMRKYEEEKQKNHRIMSKAQELQKRLVNCFLLLFFIGIGLVLTLPKIGAAVCFVLICYGGHHAAELENIGKDY
jgi:hypothetical protein